MARKNVGKGGVAATVTEGAVEESAGSASTATEGSESSSESSADASSETAATTVPVTMAKAEAELVAQIRELQRQKSLLALRGSHGGQIEEATARQSAYQESIADARDAYDTYADYVKGLPEKVQALFPIPAFGDASSAPRRVRVLSGPPAKKGSNVAAVVAFLTNFAGSVIEAKVLAKGANINLGSISGAVKAVNKAGRFILSRDGKKGPFKIERRG